MLLSIKSFDRVLFDIALKRLQIEPQRSTNLDRGKLTKPSLLIDRFCGQTQVRSGLPRRQEPLTDAPIRTDLDRVCHLPSQVPGSADSAETRRKSVTPRRSLWLGGFSLKSHHRPYSASPFAKSSNRINLLMNVNGMRPIGPFRCFAMISSARPRRSSRSGL